MGYIVGYDEKFHGFQSNKIVTIVMSPATQRIQGLTKKNREQTKKTNQKTKTKEKPRKKNSTPTRETKRKAEENAGFGCSFF